MGATSTDPLGDALAATQRQGTVRLRASTQPDTSVPAPGDARLEGVADLRTRTTLVRERMLSRDAASRLRGAAGRAAAIAGAIAAVGEAEAELLYVGGTRYVRHGAGAQWTAARGGTGAGGPRCREDPLWLLDVLAVPRAIEASERDVLGGLGATRLVGTVDLRAASSAFGARLAQSSRAADVLLRRRHVRWARAVPFVVWIDDASLLRRIAYATPPPPAGPVLWWTTDLWDHGRTEELPPAPAP